MAELSQNKKLDELEQLLFQPLNYCAAWVHII